jgi:hypothetical protein
MDDQDFALPDDLTGTLWGGMSPEEFHARVQHPDGLLQTAHLACRQVVGSLRVVQGAAVTVQFRGSPVTLAQTSSWVRRLREREDEQGAGPGLRALRTQRGVTVSRGELLCRWPALTEATTDAAVRAVHAEPLSGNQQPAGVLTLYSTNFDVIDILPGRLDLVRAQLTAALARYCTAHPHEDHAIRLHRELHNQQLLGHAAGILMARHKITEVRARRMLQEHADDTQVSLVSAARSLIRQHSSAPRPTDRQTAAAFSTALVTPRVC